MSDISSSNKWLQVPRGPLARYEQRQVQEKKFPGQWEIPPRHLLVAVTSSSFFPPAGTHQPPMDFWQPPPTPLFTKSSAPPSDPKQRQSSSSTFCFGLMRINRILNNKTVRGPSSGIRQHRGVGPHHGPASHVSATLARSGAFLAWVKTEGRSI